MDSHPIISALKPGVFNALPDFLHFAEGRFFITGFQGAYITFKILLVGLYKVNDEDFSSKLTPSVDPDAATAEACEVMCPYTLIRGVPRDIACHAALESTFCFIPVNGWCFRCNTPDYNKPNHIIQIGDRFELIISIRSGL